MMNLSKRIQIPANAISLMLLFGLGLWLIHENILTQEKMVADKATAMASFLNKASVNYLINFDLSALDGFTKDVVKDADFTYAVYIDDKGKPLTDLPKGTATNSASIVIEQPITGPDQQKLGGVKLGYTLQHIRNRIPREIALVGGIILVAQLFMTLGLGWVTRSVNRPLAALAENLAQNAAFNDAAAGQIATASKQLAQGAGEQAAAIEETSASLEELSSTTQRNTANAQKADDIAKATRQAADHGVADMRAMHEAMNAIKASSDDISKILRVIDEIAFQTNILALNAAVEAARAGEAGMGFAVVADEVRALAQRSAQAARETAAKIEGAMRNTAKGVELSAKVADNLDDIAAKARDVAGLAAEVAQASQEQTRGIGQINSAVGQMDLVTQTNAASAEESAAAAHELRTQADQIKQAVAELMKLVDGKNNLEAMPSLPLVNRAPDTQAPRPSRPLPRAAATSPAHNGDNGHAPLAAFAAKSPSPITMPGDFEQF